MRWRWIGGVCAGLALVLLCVVLGLLGAALRVPARYQQALAQPPARAQAASQELVARTAALVSLAQQPGHWEATCTEEEINGWLAIELPAKHPQALPAEIREPRVQLRPGRLWLAWKSSALGVESVISAEIRLFVPQPGTLACQVESVQAGSLPLPVQPFLDLLTAEAEKARLPLRWTQDAGQPVALWPLPQLAERNALRILEGLELTDGQLRLTGRTDPQPARQTNSQLPGEVSEPRELNSTKPLTENPSQKK